MGAWTRAAFGVAMLAAASAALADADDWRLHMDGIGPLRIGMRFEAANRLLSNVLVRTPETSHTPGCYMIAVSSHPGVALMFVNGKLSRVDVYTPGTSDEKGISVGDSVDKVLAAYPDVKMEPNAYDNREKYLTARATGGALAIRFETEDGKISGFYGGQFKSVQYIEGCL